MHAAVHIIQRLFICISSSFLVLGDNIDEIPCSINAASNREMLLLEKEGIVRDQFLRLFLLKKGTRQLYLDVEKFDRFQNDFDLEE